MSKESYYTQSDFFNDDDLIGKNRLYELEQKQDNLRRGLFKRWSEQEEKIKHLHNEIQILTGILEGAICHDL